MSARIPIGRYGVIQALMPNDQGFRSLKMDLLDRYCLRFELDGVRFAVGRDALQSLLDAYDETQARLDDLCTGPKPEPSTPSPSSVMRSSTLS